jgi:hypothetical protein
LVDDVRGGELNLQPLWIAVVDVVGFCGGSEYERGYCVAGVSIAIAGMFCWSSETEGSRVVCGGGGGFNSWE